MEKHDEIYEKISKYPLPDNTITYKPRDYTPGIYCKTTFNDLIYLNLGALVPNQDYGFYRLHTNDDMEEWINNCAEYGNTINEKFQKRCEIQRKHLNHKKKQDELSNELNMHSVSRLPLDIVREIMSFLLPETRLIYLEERNKSLKEDLKKWKVFELKTFYKEIVQKKYINIMGENHLSRCLPSHEFRGSMSTKPEYIQEIFNVLKVLKMVVPKNRESYNKFKELGTRLYMSILYVNGRLLKNKKKKNKN